MSDIWYGTSGPHNAAIAIVGESWGKTEADKKRPFVGESGKILDEMLSEAGIPRDSCFCTNVVPEQPYRNNMWEFFHETRIAREMGIEPTRGLYPKENVERGLECLAAQLEAVQPSVAIGFGNYALWALTDGCFKVSDKEREQMAIAPGAHLLESLAALSVAPEDIDTVVLSHLHFDHAGGCTRYEGDRLVPTFPRATYVAGATEWEDAASGRPEFRGMYPPENFVTVRRSCRACGRK